MRNVSAGRVFVSAGAEAVDACLLTKDMALPLLLERHRISHSSWAVIGNGVNDLPLLRKNGFQLVGAPADAQPRVLEAVGSLENGWIASSRGIVGFLEFYDRCKALGVQRVLSDRDGVLYTRGKEGEIGLLAELLGRMGHDGNPCISILTGASRDDNLPLLEDPRVSRELQLNSFVREDPWILLAENGAFIVDVLSKDAKTFVEIEDPNLLMLLKQEFEPSVTHLVRERIAKHGGGFVSLVAGMTSKKETMVTFLIPGVRAASGLAETDSEMLRRTVVEAMIGAAEELGLKCVIL